MNPIKKLLNFFRKKTQCWLCELEINIADSHYIDGIHYCSTECYFDEQEFQKLSASNDYDAEVKLRELMKKIERRYNFNNNGDQVIDD